ncbi:hypothetical protein OESDEN_05918, partial [Oesophagostomum dentatum]
FYNLPDLAKICLSQAPDVSQEGSVVQWKDSAINTYWKFFSRVDRTGTCHGYYSAKCVFCHDFEYCIKRVDEEFLLSYQPLKHHMAYMRGRIEKIYDTTCCDVKWDEFCDPMHLPQTALRLASVA